MAGGVGQRGSSALSRTITSMSSTFNTGRYRGKDLSEDQPCMFCGEPADSREDIIPSWLARQSLVPPGTTRPVIYTSHGRGTEAVVVRRRWPS